MWACLAGWQQRLSISKHIVDEIGRKFEDFLEHAVESGAPLVCCESAHAGSDGHR